MSSTATAMAMGTAGPGARTPVGGGLRLTRRGRLVVFAAFLAVALGLVMFALSGAASGSGSRGEPLPVRMVEIEHGDTLWSIATRAAPGEDPRDLITEIQQLNTLDGSLPVGESIAVPVAD